MLCQMCHVNPAGIKIAHVINEKKVEINLCKACAEKKGLSNPMMTIPQIFGNFVAELLGQDVLEQSDASASITCTGCGSTWEDFQNTGLLGCEICYQIFQEDLSRVLRRIHGSSQHIGSRPRSQRSNIDRSEIEVIRKELQAAIRNEDFELAAELRDMIRDAERQNDGKQDDGILR